MVKARKKAAKKTNSATHTSPLAYAIAAPVRGLLKQDGSLAQLLINAAADAERGIAFVQDDESELRFSYAEILARAETRLAGLHAAGLKPGMPVLLIFNEGVDFVVSFWACVLGGIVAVPMAYPTSFTQANAALSKLKVIWEQLDKPPMISDQRFVGRLGELEKNLGIENVAVLSPKELDCHGKCTDHSPGSGDALAFIQYSSGSTGKPKGVMLSHRNLLTNIEAIIASAGFNRDDKFLSWMPYNHDMGLIGFHLVPMAVVIDQFNISPFKFAQRPLIWVGKISEHGVTITGSPNFGYRLLLSKLKDPDLAALDLRSLRLIFNGAEPISVGVMREFMETLAPAGLNPAAMFPVYGMAEASLAVAFPPPATIPLIHPIERSMLVSGGEIRTVAESKEALLVADEGFPVQSCEIRIANDDGNTVAEGVVGHVQICGDNVTKGYYNNPEANLEAFDGKWLRTGDMGFMLQGRLSITGRAKDIVFVNGQKFYAHDIESCVEEVEGVLSGRVVVCGWHDSALGREQVALFVSVRRPAGSELTHVQILANVWRHVNESFAVPVDYVVQVKTVPRTTSGKLQRFQLLNEFHAGVYAETTFTAERLINEFQGDAPEEPELPDMQQRIRNIWAEVLGRSPQHISADAQFLTLGGTSLKAVQILGMVEKEFHTDLTHDFLLQCRTINEMAAYLVNPPSVVADAEACTTEAKEDEREIDGEDIAVIGMACRFPGAGSPEEFWQNLVAGVDSVQEIPGDRWGARDAADAQAPGANHSHWGGFIDDVYAFDASFFQISPEEALAMDPQQRVFLETTWQALERAGYSGQRTDGKRVGVYVGASHSSYMEYHVHALDLLHLQQFESFSALQPHEQDELAAEWKTVFGQSQLHPNTAVGNLLNMIAARVSHALNLKGPSLTVDTACSSSLVAVHLACESIRHGECEMAIAGGINLNLTPTSYELFARAGTLSPEGRCKVFDATADGFVPGEGAGVVLLKPLKRAVADGDNVLCVIKRSVVNNDGRSLGVMAPNPDGQRVAIESAYADGVLNPDDIQYVEAHGTGTAIGDPSEVRALSQAFGRVGAKTQKCAIGSVKANVGHLLSAAGIASLAKMALAIQHRQMPPSINLAQPNPMIDFPATPFRLLSEAQPWEAPAESLRRGAINSFGFGGTNCHMVVEEYVRPVSADFQRASRPRHLICLSARTETAARRRAADLAAYLRCNPELPLQDVCYTEHSGRRHFEHRLTVIADTAEQMADKLEHIERIGALPNFVEPGVALMFTGQGAQYAGMARRLYEGLPAFRKIVDECATCFDPHLDQPLLSLLYDPQSGDDLLAKTYITQPVIFTIDYALGRLLMEWGVKPACLFGHSVGEYAAACLGGVMSLADAAKLVALRGRLMQSLPSQGGMLAVFASQDELQPLLKPFEGRLWFAAHNGNHQVVSGGLEALAEFQAQIGARGKSCKQLKVSHAFHTPLMEPMFDEFRKVLDEVQFSAPRIPLVSNVNAEWITSSTLDTKYWLEHLLKPVCFAQSVKKVADQGISIFVECGPDKILSALTRSQLATGQVQVLPALDRRDDDWNCLLTTIGALYTQGVNLDWDAYEAGFDVRRVVLPTYPFERNVYRLTDSASRRSTANGARAGKIAQSAAVPKERVETVGETVPAASSSGIGLSDTVRQMVAELLRVAPAQVDMSRNFADLGLDSGAAVQFAERLGAFAQVRLPPTLLFEFQTPAALAGYLARHIRPENIPGVQERRASKSEVQPAGHEPEQDAQGLRDQDIAIIGMACRIPGADNPEEFWELLVEGRSEIREAPADRWSQEDYFNADRKVPHTTYSKWGAFVDRPYDFDPLFFGISPREAQAMDPQQRLFMEVAWESLQQSGYGGDARTREIGIFVGCEQNNYAEHFVMHQRYNVLLDRLRKSSWFVALAQDERDVMLRTLEEVLQPAELTPDAIAGNGMNQIASRLSHWLDLSGPSLAVNTACSSSLVATHLACESLRTGESKIAIAGGAFLSGNDSPFVLLSRVGALSPTGQCAPFDRRANGMVLGEGVSAIVLKPLKDAVRDGDFIHAVIKGSAINNDGHSNGITAPNPRGQAEAIRKAHRNAGVSPESISYIECHGTSTPLGDPVELDGMTQAFRTHTQRTQFCGIGSVKSSIGHMLAGSSLPSLIKVVMAMQHKMLPPTIGFDTPNPHIDFARSPFYVVGGGGRDWTWDGPLRAGVNAFGFGGTNCHLVLEQAPLLSAEQSDHASSSQCSLITLSGRTQSALQQVAARLSSHLLRNPGIEPAAVCFSMNRGQRGMPFKAAFIVSERDDLLSKLDAVSTNRPDARVIQGRNNMRHVSQLCLALDGESVMGSDELDVVIRRFPQLREIFEECKDRYREASGSSLDRDMDDYVRSFAAQYILGRLLMLVGIEPAVIVAEGTGALAGACLSGLMSIEQAAEMFSRYRRGHADLVGKTSSNTDRDEGWDCPLLLPGIMTHSMRSEAIMQLAEHLQTSKTLSEEDTRELACNDFCIVHIGSSTSLHSRLTSTDAGRWIDLQYAGTAVERVLMLFSRMYVYGIGFNSGPLAVRGIRQVPLPTYPFENKPYLFSGVALQDMVASDRTPAFGHALNGLSVEAHSIRTPFSVPPHAIHPVDSGSAELTEDASQAVSRGGALSKAERAKIALELQRELNLEQRVEL